MDIDIDFVVGIPFLFDKLINLFDLVRIIYFEKFMNLEIILIKMSDIL